MNFVIRFKRSESLTKFDIEILYKILFARKNSNDQYPEFEKCLYNIALDTKVKFNGEKENYNNFQILIFYEYDGLIKSLPRFVSDISVYDLKHDHKMYNRLRKDETFHLIGTEKIKSLSPIEFSILYEVLVEYIIMKQKMGVIEYRS
jgi:hypothetical protein